MVPGVPLAETFKRIADSLPPDWTQMTLDLRIHDEERYIEAATFMTQINAQPYGMHDWHFRLIVAHNFGHAASPETVQGTLDLLDHEGIEGELRATDARSGRVEVVPQWGRPESARQEFRRRRAQ
ncbi:MAG: hypothetical protein QOJ07_2611 [Thermoleophilaceae bacterium]|jgi:hypothetical protein|nr:hypothetical protein [Thermoleophilaceae bacterium]